MSNGRDKDTLINEEKKKGGGSYHQKTKTNKQKNMAMAQSQAQAFLCGHQALSIHPLPIISSMLSHLS